MDQMAIKSEPGTVKPEPMDTSSSTSSSNMLESSSTMQAIFAFLKKNNLTSTEEQLKAELAKVQGGASAPTVQPNTEVGNVLAAYKSDDDPTSYEAAYSDLEVFVENSLDMYRHELALILYPVFVHMYLELVYNQNEESARHFTALFGPRQESYYQGDIKKENMKGYELMSSWTTSTPPSSLCACPVTPTPS